MRHTLIALLAAVAFAPPAFAQPARDVPAAAQERQASPHAALFKAADRGEMAPLRRALATETDPARRALIEARLAAARLDPAAASDPRVVALTAPGADPQLREAALSLVGSVAFTNGDYARAAEAGAALEGLQRAAGDTAGAEATARAQRLAAMLAAQPRQSVEGAAPGGRTAARKDRVGLTRIDVTVNGAAQEAVFDTGANLSVLSASTARRLGVRILDQATDIGNGVQTTVPARIGIADRLEIAGTVLRHVPFLIIDDAQLTFPVPGGYDIPAIIGFPVMRALGRFRMDAASFAVEPAGAPATDGDGHNLHSWGNELFVDVKVGSFDVPLHLDSGANPSHLNPLFAEAHPEPLAGLPREQRRSASAGGTSVDTAVRWPGVQVEIGGRSFRAPSVLVGLPREGGRNPPYYGVIGADLLGLFESYTVDMRAMRLELGEPKRP